MKNIKRLLLFIVFLSICYTSYVHFYYFNVEKAVEYLNDNALPKSHTCCAWYVMRAMQAGGCPIGIFPAHSYAQILPFYKFKKIETAKYEKGDIVVFPAIKNHKWGHIAMWNGKQWVSDFKQKSMFPATGYKNSKYSIFRYSKTI